MLFLLLSLGITGCSSSTRTNRSSKEKSEGFFTRLLDRITDRECMTSKFTCPYGLGPANEPCECTEPSGRVWPGKTVK
jgi:hypothetical protein